MNSSRTVYVAVPVGRPAAVASDWIVPRVQSTVPVYVSSGRWLKIAGGGGGGADGGGGGRGDGGGDGLCASWQRLVLSKPT